MQKELIKQLLSVRGCIDQLKIQLRHSWTSTGKGESVAEHSWALSFLVIMFAGFVDQSVDIEKCLVMAIVHDLPEAVTGDIPYFLVESEDRALEKSSNEKVAMKSICRKFPKQLGKKLYDAWLEYATGTTYEAKFVKALDKVEAQMQRNSSPLSTWVSDEFPDSQSRLDQFCDFDSFLKELRLEIQKESKLKIQHGKNPSSSNAEQTSA